MSNLATKNIVARHLPQMLLAGVLVKCKCRMPMLKEEQALAVIGLTGGIASGKSTVASHLKTHGFKVIDADQLGHQVYLPDTEGYRKVISFFGPEIVAEDKTIDRKKLGSLVFNDPKKLEGLTNIVWPEIKRLARKQIGEYQENSPNQGIVVEAAVLIEANWQDLVDEVWVVTVEKETAVERASSRDNVSREAVLARISAQLTNEERLACADVHLRNDGTEEQLIAAVDAKLLQTGMQITT